MNRAGSVRRRLRAGRAVAAVAATLLAGCSAVSGCSPVYVLKAGYHEARILAARKPIPELIHDPATGPETRRKLRLALAARAFARDSLGLDVGDSYTTFSRLERDTLALILSAAHRDRLEPVTWWFPVVGHVPYRGFFSREDAVEARRKLEAEGYDTYLRPTSAFSTLGWFSDPLLSTVLEADDVGLVETVIHELTHNTLYLPGRARFNESFANWVGGRGAEALFCGPAGGGGEPAAGGPDARAEGWPDAGEGRPDAGIEGRPDAGEAASDACRRARDRWIDERGFSRFLDGLAAELEALYGRPGLDREEVLERREEVFEDALRRFRDEVQPAFRASRFSYFLEDPLNNATLLARLRYYHRLGDFDRLLDADGGAPAAGVEGAPGGAAAAGDPPRTPAAAELRKAVSRLVEEAKRREDPFEALPRAAYPST